MKKILILASAHLIFNLVSAQDLTTMKLTVPENISEQMPRVNKNFTLKIQNNLAEGEKSPLLIWMHGGGGGVDTTGDGWPKSEKPFKYISEKYPLSILFPQAVGRGWDGASMEVLINYVLENYPINPDRVYLSGGSMGGAGTWLVANHNPDLFAALISCMGGGLDREEILETVSFERLRHLPSWSFCGRLDKVTPIEYAIEIDSILNSMGGNPKLTIYEDMGHGGPASEAWEQEELYAWLLSHERDGLVIE
jgi:predicted peptidase